MSYGFPTGSITNTNLGHSHSCLLRVTSADGLRYVVAGQEKEKLARPSPKNAACAVRGHGWKLDVSIRTSHVELAKAGRLIGHSKSMITTIQKRATSATEARTPRLLTIAHTRD